MRDPHLPEFDLAPGEYGWSAQLPPESPLLFGKEISVEIHTRTIPNDPPTLPPVSQSQARLVHSLVPALASLVQRVENELRAYNLKFDSGFDKMICDPCIWLSAESDDGVSWTFVVERTDNPDFGYHAEFRGTDFVRLWAGD